MKKIADFYSRGYSIVEASSRQKMVTLREQIFDRAKKLVPYRGESVETFLNQFHDYRLSSTELNEVRLKLVQELSRELSVSRDVFEAFEDSLSVLVGADVAGQKTVNLVVQPPGDEDQVPTHRDAPLNSHFDVVVWVPLVDCYGTKSMFISDKEQSLQGLSMLKSGRPYREFCQFVEKNSSDLKVSFGSACFFAAGMAHGCKINVEPETRWSLNLRYKNLFSPYGPKGLLEFFEILKLSPLAQLGFELERAEHA